MLSREYDDIVSLNRNIYCDDEMIARYAFERQFECKTISVFCFLLF